MLEWNSPDIKPNIGDSQSQCMKLVDFVFCYIFATSTVVQTLTKMACLEMD